MLAFKNDAAGRHGENNRHGVNAVRRFLEQIAFYGDKIGLLAGRNDAYFVFYAKLPRAVDGVAGQHVGKRHALIGRRQRFAFGCVGSASSEPNFDAVQRRYLRKWQARGRIIQSERYRRRLFP